MRKLISLLGLFFLFTTSSIESKGMNLYNEVDVNINSKYLLEFLEENNWDIKNACVLDVCEVFDGNYEEALNNLKEKFYKRVKNSLSDDEYLELYYKGFVIDKINIIK